MGTLGADNGGGTGSHTTPPSREGNERPPTPRQRGGAQSLPAPNGQLPPLHRKRRLSIRQSPSAHANQFTELLSSPSRPSNLQTLAPGCAQNARNVPRTRFSRSPVSFSISRGRTSHRPLFAPFRRGSVFTAFALSPLIHNPHSYPITPSSFARGLGNRARFFSLVISRNPPGDLYSNH